MGKNPLAFIVEDYEDSANVFSWALEMAGYEVEVAADGAIAQKRLAEIVPDLIVLDLHIPYVPGDVLLQQIHTDARFANTRIFLATADANMASQLRDKAELILLKPISPTQLRDLAERFRPGVQE